MRKFSNVGRASDRKLPRFYLTISYSKKGYYRHKYDFWFSSSKLDQESQNQEHEVWNLIRSDQFVHIKLDDGWVKQVNYSWDNNNDTYFLYGLNSLEIQMSTVNKWY